MDEMGDDREEESEYERKRGVLGVCCSHQQGQPFDHQAGQHPHGVWPMWLAMIGFLCVCSSSPPIDCKRERKERERINDRLEGTEKEKERREKGGKREK